MLLAIETATAACSVALFEGERLIAFVHEIVGRGHAERLLPMVAALPGGGRADAILVDCGPGSFTGIRVGIAGARGLGLGWGVPVRGYSSLALVAASSGVEGEVVAIMPGGHGEIFAARIPGDGTVRSLAPDAVAKFAEGRRVIEQPDAFDARNVLRLAPMHRDLDPRPIYGRAPDAQPMA